MEWSGVEWSGKVEMIVRNHIEVSRGEKKCRVMKLLGLR